MKPNRILALSLILALLMTLAISTPPPASAEGNASGGGLNVFFSMFKIDYDEEAFTTLNGILRESGFGMNFQPYFKRWDDNSGYDKFVRENLQYNVAFVEELFIRRGIHGDMEPIEDQWIAWWATNADTREDYISGGLVGDFYGVDNDYTYDQQKRFENIYPTEPRTMYFMPTGCVKKPPKIPAVLVREDIAMEYGAEIRTASEYEELLRWLKARDPEAMPGVSFLWEDVLNLFMLPDLGYWSFNDGLLFELRSNEVYPFYAVPEGKEALETIASYRREELLAAIDDWREDYWKSWRECPTVLLDAYKFIEPIDLNQDVYVGFQYFDASGFRMYTLYNDVLPVMRDFPETSPAAIAYAGANADAGELTSFLYWLTIRANYLNVFYGEEGVDYAVVRGEIVPFEDNDSRKAVRDSFLKYFALAEYDRWLTPAFAPHNYVEELSAFSFAYELALPPWWYNDLYDQLDLKPGSDSSDFYGATDASGLALRLFGEMYYYDDGEWDAQEEIDKFLARQEALPGLIGTYVDVMNKVIDNAEIR